MKRVILINNFKIKLAVLEKQHIKYFNFLYIFLLARLSKLFYQNTTITIKKVVNSEKLKKKIPKNIFGSHHSIKKLIKPQKNKKRVV